MGLPAVEDYALTCVSLVANATSASYMIGTSVGNNTDNPPVVTGGESQSDAEATQFTFNLTDTQVGVQYWLKVSNRAPRITSMTLTYTK